MTNTQLDVSTIDQATLDETVAFVWSTLFGEDAVAGPSAAIDRGVSASVSVGGSWTATIVMEMEEELAVSCACSLLQMEPSELDDEVLFDAVGEIVNVVGGNLKGLLDADDLTLSLPVVTRPIQSIVGGVVTVRSAYSVDARSMTWRIHESK